MLLRVTDPNGSTHETTLAEFVADNGIEDAAACHVVMSGPPTEFVCTTHDEPVEQDDVRAPETCGKGRG